MSYILDALKKAEQAREYGDVPGIDSPHDQPRQLPPRRWPWVIALVLLLNALLIAGLWWRSGIDQRTADTLPAQPAEPLVQAAQESVRLPPPPASQADPERGIITQGMPADTDEPVAVQAVRPPSVAGRHPLRPLPLPPPPPLAPPVPSVKAVPAPAKTAALPLRVSPVPVAAQSEPPAIGPLDMVQLRPPPPPPTEPAWKKLPLWPLAPEEIRRQVTGRLVMNAHVYSATPGQRYVVLSMNKYRQGEQIPEGPMIEEITRDGVILAVPNGRFRLE